MIGQVLSQYKIVEKLGEGGMGVVYKALDTRLNRFVALKFLPSIVAADSTEMARFIHEAQAISSLNHSNIATIHYLEDHGAQKFLVLEYLERGTLKKEIRDNKPSIGDAVEYGIQIAKGLAYAHEQGIVHRDMKTDNVMLTKAGEIKITDFGLAKLKGVTKVTKTGSTIGTAAYMSPEQARGEDADHRSDIFSLGVVLYELVTGELPFKADHDLALMYEIVNETPQAMRQVRAEVPDELQRIVDKAMEKNAEKRYQSADKIVENLQALKTALEGGEQLSHGRLRLYTIRKIYRWLVPVAPALLVVLILLLRGTDPETETLSIAVLPLQITGDFSEDDVWLTEGIGQSIANKLTHLDNMQVTPWVTSQRYRDYSSPSSLNEIALELGVQRLIVGTIRVLGERLQASVALIDPNANQQLWVDEFDEDVSDIFEVQARIALGSAEGLKGQLSGEEERLMAKAPAQRADAYELYIKGSLKMQLNTPEDKDVALAYFDKAIELDPQLAEAYVGRGAVYGNRFFFGWAGKEALDAAIENYKKALEFDPQSSDARRGLIWEFGEMGLSEECLKQGAAVAGDRLDELEALSVKANAYIWGGLADKAVPLYERILQLDRANQGAHWHLVPALCWSLQWEKAIDAGERFFDQFGEDPEVHTWVAYANQKLGDLDAARLHIDRALTLFGDYPTDYVHVMASDIYKELGDTVRANSLLTDAASVFEERLQAHPSNFRLRGMFAQIHGRLGNLDETENLIVYAQAAFPTEWSLEPLALLLKSGRPQTARRVLQHMLSRGTNLMFALRGGTVPLSGEVISELKKEGFFQKQVELDSTYRARY